MSFKKSFALAICSFFVFCHAPGFADPVLGKQLFKEKNCVLCHDVALPGTEFKPVGPGLKNVRERHNKDWLKKWLENPEAVWETDDEDVQDINTRYFKFRGIKPQPRESFMATVVGKIILLTSEEIEHLIDYLLTL